MSLTLRLNVMRVLQNTFLGREGFFVGVGELVTARFLKTLFSGLTPFSGLHQKILFLLMLGQRPDRSFQRSIGRDALSAS